MLYTQPTSGQVRIEMRPDLVPAHVTRIKELTHQEFYDEVAFHRIIAGFISQTGDPTGIRTGRSGRKLGNEFNSPVKAQHTRRTLSMARAQS